MAQGLKFIMHRQNGPFELCSKAERKKRMHQTAMRAGMGDKGQQQHEVSRQRDKIWPDVRHAKTSEHT